MLRNFVHIYAAKCSEIRFSLVKGVAEHLDSIYLFSKINSIVFDALYKVKVELTFSRLPTVYTNA